jgi:uncharacterized protein (DUF1800 family)
MNDRAKQAAARTILRALYAPDQLRERMTWFWFNHFNVHQYKANIRVLVGDYEDRAIRPLRSASFRDLLAATLRHPAMLRYLDNSDNAAGHLNENYAREIMELHTMGVGSGYAQADVEALARILTGVGIDLKPEDPKLKPELQSQLVREGAFEFNPARHDYGDKTFLGHAIKGRGLCRSRRGARHPLPPSRDRHASVEADRDLFRSDNPPDALVRRWRRHSRRPTATSPPCCRHGACAGIPPRLQAGAKFKDPVQYVMSAVRLAYDDKVILNTLPIQNWLNRLGEGLFNHETPDGYSMTRRPGTARADDAALRDRAADRLRLGRACSSRTSRTRSDQPAFPLIQNALYFNGLRQTSGPTTLGGARSGGVAAGLEHAVPVVARIHALTKEGSI